VKRKSKQPEPSQIDRARAARAFLDTKPSHGPRDAELEAFMSIFHPKMSEDRQLMTRLKQAVK